MAEPAIPRKNITSRRRMPKRMTDIEEVYRGADHDASQPMAAQGKGL